MGDWFWGGLGPFLSGGAAGRVLGIVLRVDTALLEVSAAAFWLCVAGKLVETLICDKKAGPHQWPCRLVYCL